MGKTLVAERLPYVLYSNPKPFIVSAADIDKEKKESVVPQLFVAEKSNQNPYFASGNQTKGLVDYIKNNPGGFVRIDEYDKICTPALDEIFRTIVDTGNLNIDGQKIDCSGIVFALTSNENDMSMNEFGIEDIDKLDKLAISEGYTRGGMINRS